MQTNTRSEATGHRHPIISAKLVDAAFDYHKEIMELRHKRIVDSKKKSAIEIENETLKERKKKNLARVQDLEQKLKVAKATQITNKLQIKDLYDLTVCLSGRPSPEIPLQPNVMLRCRYEITAAEKG